MNRSVPDAARPAIDVVTDRLREQILDGVLRPGDRLSEVALGEQFAVSRNTLREAFRVLANERLVEHQPNRGVFVHLLSVAEVRDVYTTRRLLECGALREAAIRHGERAGLSPAGRNAYDSWFLECVGGVRAAVDRAGRARDRGDWDAVGTANGQFHLALSALADNQVVARIVRVLVTEIRLLFVVVAAAEDVHAPYLEANLHIAELVEAGALGRAALALEDYLLRAEGHLVPRYARAIFRQAVN